MNDSSSGSSGADQQFEFMSLLPAPVAKAPEPKTPARQPSKKQAAKGGEGEPPVKKTPAPKPPVAKKPVAKKARHLPEDYEEKRQKLQALASAAEGDTLLVRVATILSQYPDTRDCDITLLMRYWKEYESNVVKGDSLTISDLYQLTRLTSIVRARARVQNHFKLFAAHHARPHRGIWSLQEREKAIAEKHIYPSLGVYTGGSSGVNGSLITGSFWFLPGAPGLIQIHNAVNDLKSRHSFDGGFHFGDINKDNLPVYQELVQVLLANATPASFKFMVLRNQAAVPDAPATISHLLLTKGIQHEESAGRPLLPRSLQVWKAAGDHAADKLLLGAVKDKLKESAKTVFEDKLRIDHLTAVDSKEHLFLQVADLLVSSLGRVLTRASAERTPQDDFADSFLTTLRGSLDLPDNTTTDALTYHASLG